ncbi:MAG TPA: YqjK family protein [Candidatus Eisenbacteria bacterium]|nr:YqjK family protein [Candidatus Eisenbacteria bacterium]
MSEREALHARRAQLVERAAHERAELARLLGELEKPVRVVDRGLAFVRGLKRTPWLGAGIGAAMAALTMVRPRGVIGWIATGRALWEVLAGARRKASHT